MRQTITMISLLGLSSVGLNLQAQDQQSPAQDSKSAAQDSQTPDENAKIIEQLVGTYSITAGNSEGQDLREDKVADVTVKITKQTITTYDRDKQQQYSASYKLNTDQRPWKILMTVVPKKTADPSAGGKAADVPPQTSQGLIELSKDGKKLKLIYALPGGEAPKDFEAGKRKNLFELQRLE